MKSQWELKAGQEWEGNEKRRLLLSAGPHFVLWKYIGEAGARRCEAKAFRRWISVTQASVQKPTPAAVPRARVGRCGPRQ